MEYVSCVVCTVIIEYNKELESHDFMQLYPFTQKSSLI